MPHKDKKKKYEYNKKWIAKNKESHLKYKREYYHKNIEKFKLKEKLRNIKLRNEILDAYGNVCVCCGEKEILFLTIDHIDNTGYSHVKNISETFYRWLKRNNFPKDNYRILCYNCNCGRSKNKKVCPHKELKNGQSL